VALGTGAVSGLSRTAYNLIRRDIIRCRLEPGSLVSRAQLIERYELGEASIRDALSRLDQEKLVQVIPREGYVIAPVTLKQVHDLFETRLVVEPAVARLAAGTVDVATLHALDEEHIRWFPSTDRDGLEAYVAANTAFHMAIARAAGNDRLYDVMQSLLDEMERVMLLSYLLGDRTDAISDDVTHSSLIQALAIGDGDDAADAMRRQLERNRSFVLHAILRAPGLQSVNIATTLLAS
jgi:DNA-binding GntR family transcriptional regulator